MISNFAFTRLTSVGSNKKKTTILMAFKVGKQCQRCRLGMILKNSIGLLGTWVSGLICNIYTVLYPSRKFALPPPPAKQTYSETNTNKEAIWLYAELFSVITITDSHDKIHTTSGLFFPIQPKVW